MGTQKYEALIKAVDMGSLTRAAEALGYTQSGMSHIVNTLEAEWGVHLLLRDRSGVRLTPEGEALLPHIRQAVQAEGALKQQVAALKGLMTGTVRLACINSVSAYLLPRVIRSFHVAHPGVRFDLFHGDYAEVERWVAEDVVECGITMLPTGKELHGEELLQDRMMVVLPPEHPHEGERFPMQALNGAPFVYHSLHSRGFRVLEEELRQAGVKPDIHFTAKDDYSLMAMVECGLGISVLSELFLLRTPYRLIVKELDPPVHRQIGVVMKSPKRLSLAASRFLKHIKQEAAKLWPA